MAKKKVLKKRKKKLVVKVAPVKPAPIPVGPSGPSYDVSRMWSFGMSPHETLPVAAADEIVLYWPGGSLQDFSLLTNVIKSEFLSSCLPWKGREFYTKIIPAGLYCLRLPVLRTNNSGYWQQKTLMRKRETMAPVVLVVAACACYRRMTGRHLVGPEMQLRCIEWADQGMMIAVECYKNRIFLEAVGSTNTSEKLYAAGCTPLEPV